MRVSIEPLSAVPRPLVADLLRRYGFSPEVIDWKYFDVAFQPGRERGYAWVRKDRLEGMIGLIPYSVAGPTGLRSCAWTCDWFVTASKQNPGIGVLLLKTAMEREGLLTTVGGNELTSQLVPRMATHAEAEAGIELVLPLRVGGTSFFGRVQRKLPIAPVRAVGSVTLPRARTRSVPAIRVSTEEGVGKAVLQLLADLPLVECAPAYDGPHLEWHLVRCPEVQSGSATASDGEKVRAAAVFWHAKADSRSWRLVLWLRAGDADAAAVVLDETARVVARRGGQSMATIVARGESEAQQVLSAAGFRRTDRALPFYVLSAETPAPITGFSRLGFLDSDLGYRF